MGADLTFSICLGAASDSWMTLVIAAGMTSVVATSDQIDNATPIPANTDVRLAVTSVGAMYPGTDLTVFRYS